jgi:hypothetical protein
MMVTIGGIKSQVPEPGWNRIQGQGGELNLESMLLLFRVEPDLGPVPKWTPEPEPDQFLLKKTGSNSNPWFRV